MQNSICRVQVFGYDKHKKFLELVLHRRLNEERSPASCPMFDPFAKRCLKVLGP